MAADDCPVSFSVHDAVMDGLIGLPSDDGLHIRLVHLGITTIDHGWDVADVRSTYWRLYVNSRSGASVRLADGSDHALPGGRVQLIPAWVRFSCRNNVPIRHLFAHFDVVGLPGAVVREAFPRPLTLPRETALERASVRLAELLRRQTMPAAAIRCEAKAVLYRALAVAIAALPAALAARCEGLAGRSGPLAPALQAIEESTHLPIANAVLARRCRMSEDHFIRRFRALVGQTPARYVLERRVARAAQRLLHSDDAIEAIAEAHGFPDRYYFTRAFTRLMGVPPATFRRAKRA